MRKFLTSQEKRCMTDEAWELPGNIKAVARKYGIGASQILRWKASFHAFDIRYSNVEGLLSDEGHSILLKKQTLHLGNHGLKVQLNLLQFVVYDQLCADDHVCLLAAKMKRLSGHDVSLTVMQQCVSPTRRKTRAMY